MNFDFSGSYLACGSVKGRIKIYEVFTQTQTHDFAEKSSIVKLLFH